MSGQVTASRIILRHCKPYWTERLDQRLGRDSLYWMYAFILKANTEDSHNDYGTQCYLDCKNFLKRRLHSYWPFVGFCSFYLIAGSNVAPSVSAHETVNGERVESGSDSCPLAPSSCTNVKLAPPKKLSNKKIVNYLYCVCSGLCCETFVLLWFLRYWWVFFACSVCRRALLTRVPAPVESVSVAHNTHSKKQTPALETRKFFRKMKSGAFLIQ